MLFSALLPILAFACDEVCAYFSGVRRLLLDQIYLRYVLLSEFKGRTASRLAFLRLRVLLSIEIFLSIFTTIVILFVIVTFLIFFLFVIVLSRLLRRCWFNIRLLLTLFVLCRWFLAFYGALLLDFSGLGGAASLILLLLGRRLSWEGRMLLSAWLSRRYHAEVRRLWELTEWGVSLQWLIHWLIQVPLSHLAVSLVKSLYWWRYLTEWPGIWDNLTLIVLEPLSFIRRSLALRSILSLLPFLWLRDLLIPRKSIRFLSLTGILWSINIHHWGIIRSLRSSLCELRFGWPSYTCRYASSAPSFILLILESLRGLLLLVMLLPTSKLYLILHHALIWVLHLSRSVTPTILASTSARQHLLLLMTTSLINLLLLMLASTSRVTSASPSAIIASMLHQLIIASSRCTSYIHRRWITTTTWWLAEGTSKVATTKSPWRGRWCLRESGARIAHVKSTETWWRVGTSKVVIIHFCLINKY